MPVPPALSPEQRADALIKAAHSRRARADVKAKVKVGLLGISDVLILAKVNDAAAKVDFLAIERHCVSLRIDHTQRMFASGVSVRPKERHVRERRSWGLDTKTGSSVMVNDSAKYSDYMGSHAPRTNLGVSRYGQLVRPIGR